jgi:hypothetical protein
MAMCLPGYGMQGLDHLYMFVYPSFQCILVNQSLHLYKERVSAVFVNILATFGDKHLILSRRTSKKVQPRNKLQFRMLQILPKIFLPQRHPLVKEGLRHIEYFFNKNEYVKNICIHLDQTRRHALL